MTTVVKNGQKVPVERRTPESAAARARTKGVVKGQLYKPRAPIYPKAVHGFWRRRIRVSGAQLAPSGRF